MGLEELKDILVQLKSGVDVAGNDYGYKEH
jgi:hypothetical protein